MTKPDNIVAAFSEEHVEKLTGLSRAQLRYWNRIGFFLPQHGAGVRTPFARIYSFKDVVGLRTLSVLKNHHGVSLPHLREVAAKLTRYSKTPWADLQLRVWNRKVQFDEPETGKTRGVVDGQYLLLPIIEVMEEVERAAAKLRIRDKSELGHLTRNRHVNHNELVVAGTRIPAGAIQRLRADGYNTSQIIAEYPQLTEADVKAALRAGAEKAA